jgi:hypothetical protein
VALAARRALRARPPAAERATLDDLEFAGRYRRVCQQLALAQRRGYSPRVLDRLETLAQRGHDVLYRPPSPRWQRLLAFFAADYPRLVRRHARYIGCRPPVLPADGGDGRAAAVPPGAGALGVRRRQIREFERMYDPASGRHALGRESGTNVADVRLLHLEQHKHRASRPSPAGCSPASARSSCWSATA